MSRRVDPFRETQLLRARVSLRLGIKTAAEFYALPESDQEFWLAFQLKHDRELNKLIRTIRTSKYPDAGALVAALLKAL